VHFDRTVGLLVIGFHNKDSNSHLAKDIFTAATLQPYINLIELVTTTIEKIEALQTNQKSLKELQTLSAISQAITTGTDPESLYTLIHQQIILALGQLYFSIVLYDPSTDWIEIPYHSENGKRAFLSPSPVGENLPSILIRNGQPLLLEDVEKQAKNLGVKTAGPLPKSWLGVPLTVNGGVIGAIIVQDETRENRFTLEDQQFLTTVAAQVAAVIHNSHLMESTRVHTERERQLYEITNQIRSLSDMRSILSVTASEVAKAVGARRAHIKVRVASLSDESQDPG
jgi:GAF domain-containing protein